MKTKIACVNCKFFRTLVGNSDTGAPHLEIGSCRRFPPQWANIYKYAPDGTCRVESHITFPEVNKDAACGEFKSVGFDHIEKAKENFNKAIKLLAKTPCVMPDGTLSPAAIKKIEQLAIRIPLEHAVKISKVKK